MYTPINKRISKEGVRLKVPLPDIGEKEQIAASVKSH
jgi:hypothetical protein